MSMAVRLPSDIRSEQAGRESSLHLMHELKRRGGGIGIAAICSGGGQGDAVMIEVPKISLRKSRISQILEHFIFQRVVKRNIDRRGNNEVKKVMVIGAGQMGSGIAQVCAQAGYQVI